MRVKGTPNTKLDIVKEKYMYYKDVNTDARVVTVCLLKDREGNIARGVAICSVQDNTKKADGRKWAKERALSAMHSEGLADKLEASSPNYWEAVKWVNDDLSWLKFKCEYNPELPEDQARVIG